MTNGGLQKTSGQIVSIDHTKRTVLVLSYEEMDGKKCPIQTPLGWKETLGKDKEPVGIHAKMLKLKDRFFTTLIHIDGSIDDVHYFAKPADWPQQQGHTGSGQNWQPKKPRVTIAATVNLQNYENIKVEVEGSGAEECTKILVDTLNGFATRPEYSTTRDMIQSYMARVLNVPKGGA